MCEVESVSVLLCRSRKLSKDIQRIEVEGFDCWKKLKTAHFAVCRTVSSATLASADYAFNICNHMRPVYLVSKRIVHVTLTGVSHNSWMV